MSRPNANANGAKPPAGATTSTGTAAPRPARKRKKSPKPKEAKRARGEDSPAVARARESGLGAGGGGSERPAPRTDEVGAASGVVPDPERGRWATDGASECGPAPTPPNGSIETAVLAPPTTTIRLRPSPRTPSADRAVQTTEEYPFRAAGLHLIEYQTAVTRETGLLLRELLRAQLGGPASMPATPALDRGVTHDNAAATAGIRTERVPSAAGNVQSGSTGWAGSVVMSAPAQSMFEQAPAATPAASAAPPPRDYFAMTAVEAAAASPADAYALRAAPLSAPVLPIPQDTTPGVGGSAAQPQQTFVQSAFPQAFRAPMSQQQMQQLALMQHQRQIAMSRQAGMYGSAGASSVPRTMPASAGMAGTMGPPQRPFLNVNTTLANTFQNPNTATLMPERNDEQEYVATPETEHSYGHGHGQVQILAHHPASHGPTPNPQAGAAFLQSPAYSPAETSSAFFQHAHVQQSQAQGQAIPLPQSQAQAQAQAYARALAAAQAQAMAQAQAAQAQAQAQSQHHNQTQTTQGLGLVGGVQVGVLGGGAGGSNVGYAGAGEAAPAPTLFAPQYPHQNFAHPAVNAAGDLQSPFSFVPPPIDESGGAGANGGAVTAQQQWGVPDDRSEDELREISPAHHAEGA